MGGVVGFPVVPERPDHGPEQLNLEDLEPGMMVELVKTYDDGGEEVKKLGILAVGRSYEYPPSDSVTSRPRRQRYLGNEGVDPLDIVDDPDHVIVTEEWGPINIKCTGTKIADDEDLVVPAAYSMYELGLAPLDTDHSKGWHPSAHIRMLAEPLPEMPSLQQAILGVVTEVQPSVSPDTSGTSTHEYAA